jgi:hypothetical protein
MTGDVRFAWEAITLAIEEVEAHGDYTTILGYLKEAEAVLDALFLKEDAR